MLFSCFAVCQLLNEVISFCCACFYCTILLILFNKFGYFQQFEEGRLLSMGQGNLVFSQKLYVSGISHCQTCVVIIMYQLAFPSLTRNGYLDSLIESMRVHSNIVDSPKIEGVWYVKYKKLYCSIEQEGVSDYSNSCALY